jgi:hypothetical protein
MERKNIYEFNILETINNNYKTIVVLCYLDYIKRDLETVLKISIPEKLHTIYKGSKGKCEYFYINDIKIQSPNNPANLVNAKLISYAK